VAHAVKGGSVGVNSARGGKRIMESAWMKLAQSFVRC
jgi:hypothetical protein